MPTAPLTIVDARLADGTVTNVRIADGVVAALGAQAKPGDDVLLAEEGLLLPALAEAHAHLDKAFLSEAVANPEGDLMGAIRAIEAARDRITRADTEARAERAARLIATNGATYIRTHADLTDGNGLASVEALLAVRERLQHLVRLDVVALTGSPVVGPAGANQRALLRDAIALGVDGVGGCPHLENDAEAAIDHFLEAAASAGLPVDLHTDEHLDPNRSTLAYLAAAVDRGFTQRVTASHCVSLCLRPEAEQHQVAEALATAGVTVVALPASNLYLQGREHQQAMPRALAPIAALRAAGVNVAAGWDNLQDPFNPVGRGDCLETAALMVMAGHLLPHEAFHSVSGAVRSMAGLPAAGTAVGYAADLVLLPAATVREAIATGPGGRRVIMAGRLLPG